MQAEKTFAHKRSLDGVISNVPGIPVRQATGISSILCPDRRPLYHVHVRGTCFECLFTSKLSRFSRFMKEWRHLGEGTASQKASPIQCLHSRAANRLDDELTRRRSTHQFSRAQEPKQPELNLRINRRRA